MRTSLVLLIPFFLSSCIKEAKISYRQPQPSLVVEGLLLTDSTPCKVVLSYSGLFNDKGGQLQNFIDGATVYLVNDDMHDSVQLVNDQPGNYVGGETIVAKVNETYHISITLPDGQKYASFPEKVLAVPKQFSLDSIGIAVPADLHDLYGADVRIRTQDPANERNYYRWITTDYIPRKATGVPCGASLCNQYCYQLYEDNAIRVQSDAYVNGNEIRNQSVLISPYYYYGKHFIEIKQLSLTEGAYQFWKLYQEQTSRTGTIFDPLPSPLQGNIYSIDDPKRLALGYFEVSDASSLKVTLAPIFINSYYTLAYVTRYIYPDFGSCWDVYPNAMEDAPEGWNGITPLIYNVY